MSDQPKPAGDLQDQIDRRTQRAWEALSQVLHDGGWEPAECEEQDQDGGVGSR